MGEMHQMQERTKEKSLGVPLRAPRLPQVPRHRANASVRPQLHLRATYDAGRPVEPVPDSSQSFHVVILSVAERPERSTTVIRLLVVSAYAVLTHSIEPMASRFQAIGLSVRSG
jgi:hypothetical protein